LFTQTNTTLPYHPIPPCATTSSALCCYAPPEMLWILIFKQKDLLPLLDFDSYVDLCLCSVRVGWERTEMLLPFFFYTRTEQQSTPFQLHQLMLKADSALWISPVLTSEPPQCWTFVEYYRTTADAIIQSATIR